MAWEGGAWWNAGALAGQLDKYLLAMPQLEEGNPGALPGNAARDFYSGVIYGWIGYDVKADMDTCFPDDEELGHMIEDNYAAWETKDWDTIVEVGTAASQRFAQDLGACADNVKVTAAIEALSEVVLNFQDQDDWEGVI
jgi:hypothetical protein